MAESPLCFHAIPRYAIATLLCLRRHGHPTWHGILTVTVATVRGAHRYAKAIYKQGGTQKPLEETLSRELTAEECKGVHMPERALSVVLEPIDAPIRNDE